MRPMTWAIIIPIFLLLGYGMAFIEYKWKVNIAEKNIIRIYRGDEKIYEGKQAFTRIKKYGLITPNREPAYIIFKVTIYKSLFPYQITDETYVDRNIRVEPGNNLNRK